MQYDASDGARFAYDGPTLRLGSGSVASLDSELASAGCERALVVCGSTVGGTDAVMEPVRAGLGGRLAGEFPRTTPDKRLSNAYDGVAAMERHDVTQLWTHDEGLVRMDERLDWLDVTDPVTA